MEIEDVRVVQCPECQDDPYCYPVDNDTCPDCGAKLQEIEE